jgi:cytochrome c
MPSFRQYFLVATALAAPALCTADPAADMPDIEHGKETFTIMCSVCHSTQKTGGPVEGPNLIGVVGRPAGSQPEFGKYSEALKASGLTWSTELLDTFLINPMAMVPGTLMPMLIPDDKTRADVVAYLASLKPQ